MSLHIFGLIVFIFFVSLYLILAESSHCRNESPQPRRDCCGLVARQVVYLHIVGMQKRREEKRRAKRREERAKRAGFRIWQSSALSSVQWPNLVFVVNTLPKDKRYTNAVLSEWRKTLLSRWNQFRVLTSFAASVPDSKSTSNRLTLQRGRNGKSIILKGKFDSNFQM